jgi:putative transposase
VTVERLQRFQEALLATLLIHSSQVIAWCVLPNHYHALVEAEKVLLVLKDIGLMHGRSSHQWNGEDNQRGRKVWFNCAERAIRGERHFWATVNYIPHNPVHHGYVEQWQDWPFSSAASFLETTGREKAERIWKLYPVLEYGKGWDDAKL